MASRRIEHEFFCSEQVFWDRVFLDEEYNRRLFLEELRFIKHREVRREDRGDHLFRVVEVVPRVGDLPLALKKIVGDSAGYTEEGKLERDPRRYKIHVIPNKLADKLKIDGELYTQPLGDNRCLRVFEVEVTARILGVGGLLEKHILADLVASYDASAKFTNRFIREKGLQNPA